MLFEWGSITGEAETQGSHLQIDFTVTGGSNPRPVSSSLHYIRRSTTNCMRWSLLACFNTWLTCFTRSCSTCSVCKTAIPSHMEHMNSPTDCISKCKTFGGMGLNSFHLLRCNQLSLALMVDLNVPIPCLDWIRFT